VVAYLAGIAIVPIMTADPSAKPARPGRQVRLTDRQLAIALLTADGLSANEIAARLDLAATTVAFHRKMIYAAVGVKNAVMLARWLIREGLLKP
jgi:DNA-binding CsgD family transcriptional regulator